MSSELVGSVLGHAGGAAAGAGERIFRGGRVCAGRGAPHARRRNGQRTAAPAPSPCKHAIEHLDDAIAATQLGITLASLALGWVGEPAVAASDRAAVRVSAARRAPGSRRTPWPRSWPSSLITFLHVILGELAPKAVALQRPDTVSLWVAQAAVVVFAM